MLSHELFQEQALHDRQRELRRERPAGRTRGAAHHRRSPRFVETLLPAITHGLLRVPPPQRAVEGGC
jgi:hypothetical protein